MFEQPVILEANIISYRLSDLHLVRMQAYLMQSSRLFKQATRFKMDIQSPGCCLTVLV